MTSAENENWIRTRLINRFQTDTEFNQAVIRPIGSVLIALYVWAILPDAETNPWSEYLGGFSAYFLAMCAVQIGLIFRRPGHVPARRVFAIIHDHIAVISMITIGGFGALPVYAGIVWVTVGNGIRFGARYLIIAAVSSVVTLSVLIAANPYLLNNPALAATLIVTALVAPTYAYALLKATRRSAEMAAGANEAKSVFLAQASHDLRQPLHAIGLFAAQMRETELSGDQSAMLGNIEQSVHGAGLLFKSLLDVSTLESGGLVPEPRPIYLPEMFAELEQQCALSARLSDVSIRFKPFNEWVMVDPTLLATMLQNLIANAIKYAPGKAVLVGCRRERGRITIGVYDNGPGVVAAELPLLKDRFVRAGAQNNLDVSGMGLGLSIVEQLSSLLDLELAIRSVPGRGFAALIRGLEPTARGAAPDPVASNSSPRQLAGLRVVLLEDDADSRLATRQLLEKWGCDVEAFASPPRMIPVCDIIVSDFDFGSGNTLAAYKQQIAASGVPVIVITGTDSTGVKAALGDVATAILAKPLRPAELRSLLMAKRMRLKGNT